MGRYLATIDGTTEAFRGFVNNPEDRKSSNEPLFKSLGFNLEHYWVGVGESRLYIVFTAPDNDVDIQALVMAICASGIVHSMNISRIMTAEEAKDSMEKAQAILYSPPGN